ncbi:protein FAR1-RELATED SEQUENCE 5-like [Phragmites australis]|uniref:protein FAR1-RELATED SEQUENCE 5-like n=1 Tax=Phragmites australis TaxID=29695 RepID=UPI002D7751DC|nr:protein FAR1-RELATED SEQUENCE 5-like [Phragmites australis]
MALGEGKRSGGGGRQTQRREGNGVGDFAGESEDLVAGHGGRRRAMENEEGHTGNSIDGSPLTARLGKGVGDGEASAALGSSSGMGLRRRKGDDEWRGRLYETASTSESHESGSNCGGFNNAEARNVALEEFWNVAQMTFGSEDECYSFYNKYARGKGFNIRKDVVRREKKVGDIFYRRYLCCKEGSRDPELSDIKNRKRRERAKIRCDCPAQLCIRLDKARGIWFVDNFVDDHNHRLTSPDETPFLRSQRKMTESLKSEIKLMESMGIRKHVIMDILECRYGGYDKVGIIRKDIYNFSSRYKRSKSVDGDANAALEIMQIRRDKDPDFFYEYQVDAEGRMKDLFWCDAQSRMDYQSFGDIVVFDSTYRINRYKMPFVPFVGLNHHRQTTIFGCGIIGDERVESYIWLLGAFLRAMCQQKPKSIITDSDNSMMKAIRCVLPVWNYRVLQGSGNDMPPNGRVRLLTSLLPISRSSLLAIRTRES